MDNYCIYISVYCSQSLENSRSVIYLLLNILNFTEPLDVHFCNVDPNGTLMKQFEKFIPTLYEPWFPLNIHECSYLDIFPKNQLVYLTPHCQEEMREFDPDAVYIIGGIVDKVGIIEAT